MGKLINRIPGPRLLISSLPGSALRTHVELLGKPRKVNKRSQSLACVISDVIQKVQRHHVLIKVTYREIGNVY